MNAIVFGMIVVYVLAGLTPFQLRKDIDKNKEQITILQQQTELKRPTSPDGPQGEKCDQEETGPANDKGDHGEKGETSLQGEQRIHGERGLPGEYFEFTIIDGTLIPVDHSQPGEF